MVHYDVFIICFFITAGEYFSVNALRMIGSFGPGFSSINVIHINTNTTYRTVSQFILV